MKSSTLHPSSRNERDRISTLEVQRSTFVRVRRGVTYSHVLCSALSSSLTLASGTRPPILKSGSWLRKRPAIQLLLPPARCSNKAPSKQQFLRPRLTRQRRQPLSPLSPHSPAPVAATHMMRTAALFFSRRLRYSTRSVRKRSSCPFQRARAEAVPSLVRIRKGAGREEEARALLGSLRMPTSIWSGMGRP